jgi:hypothetical protein
MKKLLAAVGVIAMSAALGLSAAPAFADTSSSIPSAGWISTETVPDYILANDGLNVTYTPGTVEYSATWNPRFSAQWQDAYLVTGYSHGANSTAQAGSYGKYVYKMPLRVDAESQFTGSMTYSTSSDFDGRPGWDIWLSPSGSQNVDTTAATLEANPRTVEVLLQPGTLSYESNPGYDRIFYGVGSLSDVNIGEYVIKALDYLGLDPSEYYWAAIDGGAEMTRGSFTMDSYSLSVVTDQTVGSKTVKIPDWGATKPASHKAVKTYKAVVKAVKKVTIKATPVAATVTAAQPSSGISGTVLGLFGLGALLAAATGFLLWRRSRRRG